MRDSATVSELNASQKELRFEEVDPEGRGAIFARQFLWKSPVFEHEHFSVEVSSRNGKFHQELYLERVDGKWNYATFVKNAETDKTVFSCRDRGFPQSIAIPIESQQLCFPGLNELR